VNHNDCKSAHEPLGLFSLLLIALLFVASSPWASAQQVGASISGRIVDPSGAAIQGATVTVTSLETGAARTASADEGGNYRVLSLPVGRYEIKVEKEGFKADVQTGINLVVGQQAEVNLTLELGAMQQQVTVTAEAPVVNTSTASVAGLVEEQQVKDLPLNGRSFDNLITLNPGTVNFTTLGGTGGGLDGPHNLFAVAGRRMEQSMYLINGMEYMGVGNYLTTPGGASGQLLGIDAVREFNVLTDSYSAEYGKRPGAQVSIVTQSGTNQVHGAVFEFLRNSDLDARNYFDVGTIPPFKRNQFGGALGGPIQKDKTFIFGNYEGFRQLLNLSNVALVPDSNARQGLLPNAAGVPTRVTGLNPGMLPFMALWPLPNGPELGGGIATSFNHPLETIREDFGTVRLDHNFSDKDSVSVSYLIDDGFNATPQADPLVYFDWIARSQVASVQEQHIFSPQTLNIARVGYSRSKATGSYPDATPLPPSLSFISGTPPGTVSIGGGSGGGGASTITAAGSSNSYDWWARNQFTFSDDVQWIHGKHQFSFGAWFQTLEQNDNAAGFKAGQTSFSTLTTFLQGTVSTFQGAPDPTEMGYRMKIGAWYVQDKIALRPNLILSLGLRHEFDNGWNGVNGRISNFVYDPNGVLETTPEVGRALTQNNAKWMFNPRAGLAWDVFGNGKTSIRAAGGIYHQLQDDLTFEPDNSPPYNGRVSFGSNTAFLPLIPIQPGVALPPQCGPGVPSPCTTYAPIGLQPNLKIPTVDEWNLAVEQQITRNTAFSATYVGSRSVHLIVIVDTNSIHPQICSNSSGCTSGGTNKTTGFVPEGTLYIPVTATLPNRYLSVAKMYQSEGSSSYNGLQLNLTHRVSQGLQFRANYTWSKNLDDGSPLTGNLGASEANVVMEPYNVSNNWGPSMYDITHQASISGSYELPLGHGKPWLSGVSGAADKLVSGWQANSIVTLLSGFPFSPDIGTNQSGNGDTNNPDRPSWNPAFKGPIITGSPSQWYNPNAFEIPVSGTWGNVARNPLRGPSLAELDLSLFKTTAITERLKLEFRTEVFNIMNTSNFSFPNINVFSGGAISPTAGVITATATTSRQIQFGLKLLF